MKETGLMFKAPLVCAILAGQKTQTRRALSDRTLHLLEFGSIAGECHELPTSGALHPNSVDYYNSFCPMGKPGDRIYVRETWADLIAVSPSTDEPMAIGPGERLIEAPTSWTDDKGRTRWHYDGQVIAYRANSNVEFCDGDGFSGEFADKSDMPRWRPSIHMPKAFARIWLEITGVRVERLQQITEADAKAEGVQPWPCDHPRRSCADIDCTGPDYLAGFRQIWESTGGDWAANPWVWAIDFKTISTTGRPA